MSALVLDPPPENALGLVVLSTDETLENEAREILANRPVRLHHSRIFVRDQVTPETLADMTSRIAETTALLPETVRAVGYACTSASVVIGPDAVAEQVRRGRPGVAVTDPISAVTSALSALGARRIGLVTPYVATVVAPMRAYLSRQGFETICEVSFDEGDDRRVARIAESVTADAARKVADGADAVFLSCTNLRSLSIINSLESELQVPVISSNLALIWHLLSLGAIEASGWGPGRLFAQEAGRAQTS